MTEPEEPDFDFDAHIAKLIARSEQTLGINDKLNDRFKVRFDCDTAGRDDEDEDNEEDFEEFPDDFLDDDMLMMMGSSSTAGRSLRGVGLTDNADAAVQELSAEEREALELQFERTLEEYEDGEIGYLSDVSEEDKTYYCMMLLLPIHACCFGHVLINDPTTQPNTNPFDALFNEYCSFVHVYYRSKRRRLEAPSIS